MTNKHLGENNSLSLILLSFICLWYSSFHWCFDPQLPQDSCSLLNSMYWLFNPISFPYHLESSSVSFHLSSVSPYTCVWHPSHVCNDRGPLLRLLYSLFDHPSHVCNDIGPLLSLLYSLFDHPSHVCNDLGHSTFWWWSFIAYIFISPFKILWGFVVICCSQKWLDVLWESS